MLKCSRSMSGGSRYWKAEPPSRPGLQRELFAISYVSLISSPTG